MDSEDLSTTLLKAGEEYLAALRRLHLEPDGLLWARENEVRTSEDPDGKTETNNLGDWHLVLVTSTIDVAGPLAMNALLFKAYNLSATPQEISPFIVDVMSTNSGFVRELVESLREHDDMRAGLGIFGFGDGENARSFAEFVPNQALVDGLWFNKKWIYHLTNYKPKEVAGEKAWRDFKRSVNALAA